LFQKVLKGHPESYFFNPTAFDTAVTALGLDNVSYILPKGYHHGKNNFDRETLAENPLYSLVGHLDSSKGSSCPWELRASIAY